MHQLLQADQEYFNCFNSTHYIFLYLKIEILITISFVFPAIGEGEADDEENHQPKSSTPQGKKH